jgi:hypothetical protein
LCVDGERSTSSSARREVRLDVAVLVGLTDADVGAALALEAGRAARRTAGGWTCRLCAVGIRHVGQRGVDVGHRVAHEARRARRAGASRRLGDGLLGQRAVEGRVAERKEARLAVDVCALQTGCEQR